jgi:hypothetical protein
MVWKLERRQLAALLSVPFVLGVLVREVPRFIFAACSYYTSCVQSTFTVTATPGSIALNETALLEAQNAQCPCTWQIQSQPGGWQLGYESNCTVTLSPVGSYGNPGTIVVQCSSGGTCSKTVSIAAGCSTFRVQASLNGGSTWSSNTLTIQGKPGNQVDIKVRVTMTATDERVQAWSYSLVHSDAAIAAAGGGLEVLSASPSGTHTTMVQGGGPPDFESTEVRQDATGTLGFTQGVVIDYELLVARDPVLNFVTAGACYRLILPSPGSYQATISFTDDIADGRPPIHTSITQQGTSVYPCQRGLVLNVYSSPYSTPPPSTCSGPWITSADGIPGPPPSGGGGAGNGGPGVAVPPVLLADTDDNSLLNLTDAVVLLNHLFLGGPQPPTIDTTRVLRTNQVKCYVDVGVASVPCESALPGQPNEA